MSHSGFQMMPRAFTFRESENNLWLLSSSGQSSPHGLAHLFSSKPPAMSKALIWFLFAKTFCMLSPSDNMSSTYVFSRIVNESRWNRCSLSRVLLQRARAACELPSMERTSYHIRSSEVSHLFGEVRPP